MTHSLNAGLVAFLTFLSCLTLPAGEPAAASRTIGYLTRSASWSAEDSAAMRWLSSVPNLRVSTLTLGKGLTELGSIDVLWIHIPDSASYDGWRRSLPELAPLQSWYEGGGRFLFTGLAAMIPHEIGIEPAAPTIEAQDIENDWLFDQKGFQGYRGHPLFDGLFGGTFTWDADSSRRLWCAGYFGKNMPVTGKVVAVEKAYITISADRRLVIEYDTRDGKGKGIAAGGFVRFTGKNNRRANLEKFLVNALLYVTGELPPGRATYWSSPGPPVRTDMCRPEPEVMEPGNPPGGTHGTNERPDASSGLLISRDSATSGFYDLAGRRALVMGIERGGIDELWVHPYRLLRDYRAGVVSGDSILWLNNLSPRIEVRPESFTRIYDTPFGPLKEEVVAGQSRPVAVVRYEFTGRGSIMLAVKFRTDLRLMWPYDSPATGTLLYCEEPATGAFLVSQPEGEFCGAVGTDAAPTASLSGQFDSIGWSPAGFTGRSTGAAQIYHAAVYGIGGARRSSLTVAMTGAYEGSPGTATNTRELAANDLRAALDDPSGVRDEAVRHYASLLSSMLTVETPDREFNDLFKWALAGADRFFVNTPGVGEGLLAGYSTTARGWDGEQTISGRPGYAWYFGRDAAWSGFAIDDYGDFASVRAELELMQKYQDLSGKIFHEISTSGSVHYDAADATPLYVQLAAHYLRASGDTAFIRESWPFIRKALDYLYSTDTDGDGLIENTNQGHGWVEGGKLYPVHTEFYLAGAWGKALLDAWYVASALGMTEPAGRYRSDGGKVREILNRDFWNPRTQFFNIGKLADGSYNPEPTVLPATVMYYGLLDEEKVGPVLEQYAGSGFSSDWGVRIVSSSSALFNPQGYHYGSVWPLFTGWTALAEYEYGNATQGFTHILNNLYIKNHWALGFVEEVMNGAFYKPSGVCPHQCWSETNILHPVITGMIGWKPDAPGHSAGLFPRFPVHWDSVKVGNLRAGNSVVNFVMTRGERETRYSFDLLSGDPETIVFAPEIPVGMTIGRAALRDARGEREISLSTGRKRGLLDPPVRIDLRRGGTTQLTLTHTGGIGVVPAMPRPEPGDSSTGHRIISAGMRGGAYQVVVEGRPGMKATIAVRTFDQPVRRVENARIADTIGENLTALEVVFPESTAPYARTTVRVSTGKP